MPLQTGEIWDNTAKQCLGTEHNGGFADVLALDLSNPASLLKIHEWDDVGIDDDGAGVWWVVWVGLWV